MQAMILARSLVVTSALLLLGACGTPPASTAYQTRGGPESLLDVSAEVVSLGVSNATEIKELGAWIAKDHPSRAELNCASGDPHCRDAQKLIEKAGIPFVFGTNGGQSVTLVYERIVARDCNPSYVDNPHNYYNTNHAAFGCAVSANIVQHVTDKQEFINPSLSDDPSAVRGVNDLKRAYTPRPIVQPYTLDDSLVEKARSQQ
jgi:hypothetical protein